MQKQKLFFFNFFFFIADNISISMYIMCVILCLLSALSRRVGRALQISIIIIIIVVVVVKKTGKSDLAENPKAQKWKLPFKKSHNAKVAWYPSDSF